MAEINIDPELLKPNSYKYRDEQKKAAEKKTERERLSPVARKDNLVQKKKGLGDRIVRAVVSEDIEDFKDWIVKDVIIPGAKDFMMDFVEGILFPGEKRSRRSSGPTLYSKFYTESRRRRSERTDRERRNSRREPPRRSEDRIDYRDLVFKNREEAEDVVIQMHRRIDDFGWATIADLYDLVEIPCEPTDYNWGWTRRRDIDVRKVSSGYLIDVASVDYVGDR